MNDISKLGGGQLGRHKSHRIGLDADVNLTVKGRRIGVKNADYERQRPLVQELVTLIRDNPVLPIKTIGFNDPKMPDVAQWAGHKALTRPFLSASAVRDSARSGPGVREGRGKAQLRLQYRD